MEGYLQPPATLPDFLSESDWDSEISPEFSIKEEMIEEVMRELYKEIAGPAAENVETAPVVVVESGKGESCGASVSETTSSVMVGVKFAEGNRWGGEEKEGNLMDGCDEMENDDEWLERVMEWGPVEIEGWEVGS